MTSSQSPGTNFTAYQGERVVLSTKHSKERVIAPIFREILGCEVILSDLDTDEFGTFDGQTPRIEPPLETCVAKAQAGMALTGAVLGIASEGSIGPDPHAPFLTSDTEIVVFIDTSHSITLVESVRSLSIVAHREVVHVGDDLTALTKSADFPRHGLIVRPPENTDGPIFKGIVSEDSLQAAIDYLTNLYGSAVVENDFRACFSPSRMAIIQDCAERLARRIAGQCPVCGSPGWGSIAPHRGLPCAACSRPVPSAIRAERFGCPLCPAVTTVPRPEKSADPRWCDSCNP